MKPRTKVLAWILFFMLIALAYPFWNHGRHGHAIVLAAGPVLVLIGIVLARKLRTRADQSREFFADDQRAHEAVLRGQLDEARQIYDKWRTAADSRLVTAATHLVATLDMRLGRMQQAIEILDAHVRNARGPLLPHTTILLATNHALLGDLDAAKTWLDKTPTTVPQGHQMPAAQLAFARAVLDCRAGRCADAARTLDERWPEIESQLKAHQLPQYRIVRAFAHANAGVRNAGVAESELAVARPSFDGEHAFLGKAWPEMATFLASHNLA